MSPSTCSVCRGPSDMKAPRPLDGITVVAIEHAIAAPFCTRQLADLGARVALEAEAVDRLAVEGLADRAHVLFHARVGERHQRAEDAEAGSDAAGRLAGRRGSGRAGRAGAAGSRAGALDQIAEPAGGLERIGLLLQIVVLHRSIDRLLLLLRNHAGLDVGLRALQAGLLGLAGERAVLVRHRSELAGVVFLGLQAGLLLGVELVLGVGEVGLVQAGDHRRLRGLLLVGEDRLRHPGAVAAIGSSADRVGVEHLRLLGVLVGEFVLRRVHDRLGVRIHELAERLTRILIRRDRRGGGRGPRHRGGIAGLGGIGVLADLAEAAGGLIGERRDLLALVGLVRLVGDVGGAIDEALILGQDLGRRRRGGGRRLRLAAPLRAHRSTPRLRRSRAPSHRASAAQTRVCSAANNRRRRRTAGSSAGRGESCPRCGCSRIRRR